MTKKKLLILAISFFCFSLNLFAQSANRYVISGKIVNMNSGEPLPGANIGIVNTVLGTSTDAEGQFEFTTTISPGEYRLRITFIGFTAKTIPVTLSDELTVNLGDIELRPDIIGSDEIVVTGTSGAVSKQQLGNAISSVNFEDIQSSGATQIDQALSGKVAGALVQQNSGDPAGGISIRLRGPSSLLGSADPLYIIDGVIVNNDSPELIDIGGTAQNRLVDINPNDIERIEVVKGAAAAALFGSRANNGVVQIFTKRGQTGKPKITYNSNVQISSIRKKLPVNMAQVNNDGSPNPDIERFDFQDFIFRTAVGTDQSLSISGGSNETRYFISGSFFSNEGIVKGNDFERVTARLNLDQTLTNWANLSIGINYSNSRSQEVPNGGLNSSFGALTGFIFGPNTFDPRPDPETGEFQGGILANPLEAIQKYDFNQEINRVVASAKVTILPVENVSIDYTLGLDSYEQASAAFIPPGTSAPGLSTGFGRRAERSFLQLNNDINIRYNSFIAKDLELTSLVGGSLQYEEVEQLATQSTQFSPFVNVVGGGSNFDQPGEFLSEIVIYGAFTQHTLGYKDKYFLTAAGRFDASSVFGRNDRWQFFPKVSGSYVVSNESFWQETFFNDFISSLKLRASIGASGGQTSIGAFDRFTTFNPQSVNGRSALIPSTQQGALNVEPERQREVEFGVDSNFLNDRVSVEFTWFDQRVNDLLLFRNTAASSGFFTQLGNFGRLDNRGVEILLRAVPVNNSNLQWISTSTFSTYNNKVSGIEGNLITIPESFGQVAAINGEPLGVFFSSAFERDSNGEIVLDENGLPLRATENKIIGDPNPEWIASFINELNVGDKWNFRMQWDLSIGNDVFNFTRRLGSLPAFGTHGDLQKELEGDLPEGFNSRVFGIFEHWIEDGSYGKLRELSASYSIFPELFGLRSVRFSVIGRNLFSIDSFSGFDPETNVGGQRTAVRGFDFVQVPIPRNFQFGLTANF